MAGDDSPLTVVPSEVSAFAVARERVLARIAEACTRSDRRADAVTLVAVSKTVTVERVRAAISAGLTTLGENRVQEAASKIPELAGASWHLVGPLQSNKARRAVELFDVVEAVDSVDLASRLARIASELRPGRPLPILLEVNVDGDSAKAGFRGAEVEPALEALAGLQGIEVAGLMTIGRLVGDPEAARPTFVALRRLSEQLRGGPSGAGLGPALSMGMTDDYPVAVEEGATIVRIGRALFGERPHAHGDGPIHGHAV